MTASCTLFYVSTQYYFQVLSDVEVNLLPLNHSVTENKSFPVCAELTAGLLGCNITVPLLVVPGGSALRENKLFLCSV